MKSLILAAVLACSFAVKAETYVCDIKDTDMTLTFGLVERIPDQLGWDYVSKYKLSIQTTELPFADYVEYGVAFEEDVYFRYVSNTSDIIFSLYLDEMEEETISLKGKRYTFHNCRWHDFNQQ